MHNIAMFDLHLRMKPVRHGQLHIHIPWQFRLFFAALAGLTAWVAIQTSIWSPVGIGVLVLALLVLLYDERWVFDQATGEVHHRLGVLFIAHHLVIGLRDIDHFEYREIKRKNKRLVQLVLWTVYHEPLLVESQNAAYKDVMIHEAQILADFCNKPLQGIE